MECNNMPLSLPCMHTALCLILHSHHYIVHTCTIFCYIAQLLLFFLDMFFIILDLWWCWCWQCLTGEQQQSVISNQLPCTIWMDDYWQYWEPPLSIEYEAILSTQTWGFSLQLDSSVFRVKGTCKSNMLNTQPIQHIVYYNQWMYVDLHVLPGVYQIFSYSLSKSRSPNSSTVWSYYKN